MTERETAETAEIEGAKASTSVPPEERPKSGPPAAPSAPPLLPRASGRPTVPADADETQPLAAGGDELASTIEGIASRRIPSAPSLEELASQRTVELSAVSARDPARRSEPPVRASTPSMKIAAGAVHPIAAYDALVHSPRLDDLAQLTRRVVADAARARASEWAFLGKVVSAAEDLRLSREDAETRFGNVLDVLATGGEGGSERALASALWAHAIAERHARTPDALDTLAGDVLWLATHTSFDATPLLDRALGEDAEELWGAIAGRVRRGEHAGYGGMLGRGEAIVACSALAASGTPRTRVLCAELERDVKDPVLLRVLATGDQALPAEVRLEGELLPTPRGLLLTAVLGLSGILLAVHAARLFGRLALAYRRPAEVSLSEAGVRVKTRTELLGRVLREKEHVILRPGLVRVVREVRFPRLAFYAGLMALVLGSYVGVRTFADGVRGASPSLLVVGLLVVAIGIGADFILGTLLPGSRGRCRVAFVPRSGPTLCIGDVDLRRADDALARSLAKPAL